MRILNFIPALLAGGAERQASYLTTHLVRLGHEVHVAYTQGRGNEATFGRAGVILHRLQCSSNYDPRLLTGAVRLIRSVKPDVIHTWILQMDIVGGLAAMLTHTPWLMHEQSMGALNRRSIKNAPRAWVASGASAIVSNSKGGDDYWSTRLPTSRRHIIPNGLPADLERAPAVVPEAFGFASSGKFIVYAGRLEPSKNILNMLRAFSVVMADEPINAIVCGDGSLRSAAERYVEEAGLTDRILFTGFTSQVWSVMKSAELFVFTSLFEGCPNVVQEAMACSCPTVLSDIPAHREITDESATIFVDPSSPEDIARGIRQALAHPEETRAMAMRARAKTSDWTVEVMARNFESVYQSLTATGSGA